MDVTSSRINRSENEKYDDRRLFFTVNSYVIRRFLKDIPRYCEKIIEFRFTITQSKLNESVIGE